MQGHVTGPQTYPDYQLKEGAKAYKLQLPLDNKIHSVFHVYKLKVVPAALQPQTGNYNPTQRRFSLVVTIIQEMWKYWFSGTAYQSLKTLGELPVRCNSCHEGNTNPIG
ncbi:hypothetical protein CR513_20667, partial [Mucuna pruriens]